MQEFLSKYIGSIGLGFDLIGFIMVFLFGDFKSVYSRVTSHSDIKINELLKQSYDNRESIDAQERILTDLYQQMLREYPLTNSGLNVNDVYLQLLCGNRAPQNSIEQKIISENNTKSSFLKRIQPIASEIQDLQTKRRKWKTEYLKLAFTEDKFSFIGFSLILLGFVLQLVQNLKLLE